MTIAAVVVAAPSGAAVRRTSAASVYVTPRGHDKAGGGSTAAPYRTIRYAVTKVPSGATVHVAPGSYASFVVSRPNITVIGQSRAKVIVRGNAGARGVVTLAAAGDRVTNLSVTGCRPNPRPYGSFEFSGSASVLVRSTALHAAVTNVTVTNGTGTNSYRLRFGCFGVYVAEGNGVTISGNDISGQGEAIFLFHGGKGVRIKSNLLHDNRVEIRNTTVANDDFGGTGVGLFETVGRPGVSISANRIYNNYASSHDYGTDGGAFDLFQASDATISGNVIYNNENVVETGAGTKGYRCADNVFTGNKVSGKSAGSKIKLSVGMILRCATRMRITNNTFSRFDWYTFDIEQRGTWAGALDRLTISGNRIAQHYDLVFALLVDPRKAHVSINHNRYSYAGSLGLDWRSRRCATLRAWRVATGMDAASSAVASR